MNGLAPLIEERCSLLENLTKNFTTLGFGTGLLYNQYGFPLSPNSRAYKQVLKNAKEYADKNSVVMKMKNIKLKDDPNERWKQEQIINTFMKGMN